MALNTTELRQDRAKIVEEMRKHQDGVLERGTETPEEKEKFEKMEKDIRSLEVIIEREEKLQAEEAKLAKSLNDSRGQPNPTAGPWDGIHYPKIGHRTPGRAEIERRVSFALQGWLRSARADAKIEQEHLDAAKFLGLDLRNKEIALPISKDYRQIKREFRDLNVATGTKGQETIPEGFVNALEMALLQYGGVRAVAEIVRTDSGNDLPWPTVNDTSNKGAILAEETSFGSGVDPSFSQVIFKAFKYSSKPILVSFELLQDSAFDLGARIGEMLGIRIGRIQNDHFTTGGGTTLPKGFTVAGTAFAALDDVTISADDVIGLEHSVDPAYRMGASFMMHDQILAKIRLLKESTTNAFIWQPGLQAGVPDRLLGYPYTINQSMASTTVASAKVMAFGDFSKYKVRDVATIRLLRLDELYAATDQVAFIAYMRTDGNLLDAGTHPIKYLQLLAS